MKAILKKLLALLCFLVLPILFYSLTAFFMAAVFQTILLSMDETSKAALFLNNNLPILYSGCAAILAGSVLGYIYFTLKKNTAPAGFSACGGLRQQGYSSPPQCDPPEGFCRIGNEVSYTIKKRTARPIYLQKDFPFTGYIYVILFGAMGAVFFNLLMELSRLPELLPSPGSIENAVGHANPILHFLSVCLLLPVTEEIVFRGLGYFQLRRFFGPVSVAILTAALFGVFHGNAPQTLYGFCMGLLLAHTAESCQNLISVILFHWAANIASFTLLKDPASQRLLYSIPILGLSGIGCAWLFCKIRDFGAPDAHDDS